ncbi:MAG: MobF family relaxase [Allobranchiibius sp.]
MKTFRDSPADARHYVEADRGRADDYYLTEETGIAERFVASPDAGVSRLGPLTGDGYEAWVAGVDPDTGEPKGRLRNDEHAVRFVEVTVNGPKSWSLAAELHPDISAAYDAAQDRAARQIVSWLAQHATVRVGSRGHQVQVPVTEIEAVTVAHRTSRAGDPHRHLHLQVNARVQAEGAWRGLHTVGVRDSIDAINGIGHAAVMTDPAFRAALAGHGFTLDEGGEVVQLRGFVGPFSARSAQIGRNIERYEKQWRAANPGREPDKQLWRVWDARAWADGRPDKIVPRDGAELTRRWVAELQALCYRDQRASVPVKTVSVGGLDRDGAVVEVLARLAARRSGWNAADVRGEVEQLIARANIVTDSAVRSELAEDLTTRTLTQCLYLVDRPGLPEHIRALTSAHVLEVEAELTARLAARADTPSVEPVRLADEVTVGLDSAQRAVVAALSGDRQLVVVEGAAGAGKTTTLAATRTAIEARGARLRVVTPTLKAARVAARQVGSDASSAAWLAYQHGFRWDGHGAWTRLKVGEIDPDTCARYASPKPAAVLASGDLLLVDEAGMLDQDTARALLTIADEHSARVGLVGDRHQLPAVGRGGVLDLAARWARPDSCVTLDTVHRFTRTVTNAQGVLERVPDEHYAQLSLAMRTGDDAAVVFDVLLDRGQIRVHSGDSDRLSALAGDAARALAEGRPAVVVADTNEQVAALNHAIRGALIVAGRVDDSHTSTGAGSAIGVRDQVVTRRNNTTLAVANRDSWTVTAVSRDGAITVTGEHGDRGLPASYVREFVELGYATTVHGVQGDTATTGHLVVGEHTSAGSAYVGMTRGREHNYAHFVADSVDEAREQWVAAFGRDRADLGPAHAAHLAEVEAARYAAHRPLEVSLAELHAAWTTEQNTFDRLVAAEQRRDLLIDVVALTTERDSTVPGLKEDYHDARMTAADAQNRLHRVEAVVSAHADGLATVLAREWDHQREPARQAARTVREGTGLFGRGRAAVTDATEHVQAWSDTWRPYLADMPITTSEVVVRAAWFDNTPAIHDGLHQRARQVAEHAHPDSAAARIDVDTAIQRRDQALRVWRDTQTGLDLQLSGFGRLAHHPDPARLLTDTEHAITARRAENDTAHQQVIALLREPALRSLPGERITNERQPWSIDRDHAAEQRRARSAQRAADSAPRLSHDPNHHYQATPEHDRSINR